jgi:hypothetical protein
MIRRVIPFILVIVSFRSGFVAAQPPYTREMALEAMDGSASFARTSLNDPVSLEHLLIWDMVRPAGDDPRVLDTCIYVIDHSTTTGSIWEAVSAVGLIASNWGPRLPKNAWPKMAAALDRASKHDDFRVRSAAARDLVGFGGGYKLEGYQRIKELIREYAGKIPDHELVGLGFYEDLPETAQLAADMIGRSTDTQAVAESIGHLEGPIAAHISDERAPEKAKYIALIRRAIGRKDLRLLVRSRAADVLTKAGAPYSEEAYRAFLELLQNPGDLSDADELTEYIRIIDKVAAINRPDSTEILRRAILPHYDFIRTAFEKETAHLSRRTPWYQKAKTTMDRIDAIVKRK